MKTRIYLAGLFHETNTFVETPTPLSAFMISRGEEIFSFLGNDSPMDGFLKTAADFGWEVVPGIDYRGGASGPLLDSVFDTYWDELKASLTQALAEGIQGITLILHGAMATENYRDVEGELLARIRALPGAETLPIFAVLDLHANVSERMAQNATALIPYRENPHSDARETAVRAARLLRRALTESKKPTTYFLHSRLLLAPPSTGTADAPMKPLQALARSLEKSAGHWEVGVAPGFAHADTPDTGMTFWVVSTEPEMSCYKTLETLNLEARSLVAQLDTGEWKISDALDKITKEKNFPALLVEPADNIGGGTAGDATFLLRALLERPLGTSGVIINDPAAVKVLSKISPGKSAHIALGGRGSSMDLGPVEIEVTLVRLTDGVFELEDKQSHLASMAGSTIHMGPCAVVTKGLTTILITSNPTPPFDLGQWTSQGIDPRNFDIIGIKAAVGHRRSYDPITGSSFTVQTPGPCSSDLHSLPFQKLRRPIFPLDR